MTQESINPFSSQFVNPLACRFIPPNRLNDSGNQTESQAISGLCDQILKNRNSQIIGPHGCGKSTLASRIAIQCRNRFSSVHSVILRARSVTSTTPEVQWNLDEPFSLLDFGNGNCLKNRLVVVDGTESIPLIHRLLFLRRLRSSCCSTVVTTHKRMIGIPTLVRIKPELNHFLNIVESLQSDCQDKISVELAKIVFGQFNGNYRNAIWELYDHWELIRSQSKQKIH